MTEKQQVEQPQYDPAQQAKLYADIAQKSGRLVTQFLERSRNGDMPGLKDELGLAQAFFQAWSKVLSDPFKLAEAQMKFGRTTPRCGRARDEADGQTRKPSPTNQGDRRFKHDDWQQSFLYDYISSPT